MKNSLNKSDYDELETCLSRFKSDRAMNLEEVDGFFTALICSPEITPPSVYLNEIWGGGEMPDDEIFNTSEELQRFINLIMSHWNIVVKKLSEDEVFLPVLLEESRGTAEGNDWAKGFIRGTQLNGEDWAELVDSEEKGGSLVPIFTLANEHHPDPEMRPYKEPISPELREKLILGLAVGAMNIYKYFKMHRQEAAISKRYGNTFKRESPKVGRNEPCPCGSGRKFKKCCGNIILN